MIDNMWKEFGIIGLLAGAGTGLLFLVVKWTLETTKEILRQAALEREIFAKMQESWIRSLNEHSLASNSFHIESSRAQEFQRQEHERMIQLLDRIEERTRRCLEK
jgi:hypothetical protein